MKRPLVFSPLVAGALLGIFLLGLPGFAFPGEMTLCECVNEPIRTDQQAQACGKLTERLGPQVVATGTLKCRETLAAPAEGPDICFCMRSNSQDPAVQQACLALVENMSSSDMYAVTKDCASK